MEILVFKFVGSSEVSSPLFGRVKPGQDIKIVTEEKDIKLDSKDRVYFASSERVIFLGGSPEWEPVSKSAKDIYALVDPDHLHCDLEKGAREHFMMFHPDAIDDWDRLQEKEEESGGE